MVLRRPFEPTAEIGKVESTEENFTGKATNRDLGRADGHATTNSRSSRCTEWFLEEHLYCSTYGEHTASSNSSEILATVSLR
jgi:hypothetical protein